MSIKKFVTELFFNTFYRNLSSLDEFYKILAKKMRNYSMTVVVSDGNAVMLISQFIGRMIINIVKLKISNVSLITAVSGVQPFFGVRQNCVCLLVFIAYSTAQR